MSEKSARIRLGAAIALFFLWVASLIAMAVYSANAPPSGPNGRSVPRCLAIRTTLGALDVCPALLAGDFQPRHPLGQIETRHQAFVLDDECPGF